MFEHLQKLEVVGKTILVEVPEIAPKARIRCNYAGQTNRVYMNARVKAAAGRPGVRDVLDAMDINREDDAVVYPSTIFVEFLDVVDKDGNAVPYNVQAGRDLIAHLPDWLFDRIRKACENESRFIAPVEVSPELVPN